MRYIKGQGLLVMPSDVLFALAFLALACAVVEWGTALCAKF